MAKLGLQTVELISTTRKAPLNGSPSSQDFNDGEREKLADLSAMVSFINDTLLPLLNALPAGALLPPIGAVGIEGRTIYSDTSDLTGIFYDALAGSSLSLADSLRILNGMISTQKQTLLDLGIQVAALQSRLASTNQNNIALALQNLTDSLNAVINAQKANTDQITALQNSPILNKSLRVTTGSIGPQDTESIPVTWAAPFADNLYTVTWSLEDNSGYLVLRNFAYQANGAGILVRVYNMDPAIAHIGTMHVRALHD